MEELLNGIHQLSRALTIFSATIIICIVIIAIAAFVCYKLIYSKKK